MTPDKKFRDWMKQDVSEVEKSDTRDATKKAKFRGKKEKQGWFSVGFTGPSAAVEHIKQSWKEFKNQHAHLWDE